MTRPALIYAWTITALGAAILAAAAWQWQSAHWTAFGLCLALALFASTLKLKLAGLPETISPGFVFLLVSVAILSWTETVVIAVASGLAQNRRRLVWICQAAQQPHYFGYPGLAFTSAICRSCRKLWSGM
jgi:hypothetical protein